MANFGTVFNEAEDGWTRYDSEHIALKYEGDWQWSSNPAYYGGNRMAVSKDSLSSKVKFDFEGDSIRLISSLYPSYSDSLIFKIDGKEYPFSQSMQGTTNRALCFELNNIGEGRHTVEIYKIKSGAYSVDFFIDAIDIKKPSRLYHPDEVSNIKDLSIGKRIACNYKVYTQNQIGAFSKLGGYNENVKCLKKEPVALPDGMFYFIMVDEINKKKKLIADRNIQNYISWQTINENGFVFGSPYVMFDESKLTPTIPKMNGYTLGEVSVSASSEQDPCWRAFNKDQFILENSDNRNYWYTGPTPMPKDGHWLKVDYGTPTKINSYKIAAVKDTGYGTYAPKDWVIEGSNDNNTWFALDKKEGFIFSSNGNEEVFNLLKSEEFRYYRIRITKGAHGFGYTMISYLQFYSNTRKDTYDYYLKLLSGGTAGSNTAPATDKDNEWDKYIVNSSLNGLIMPGDDNVWNWGVEQSSWTSTTGVVSNVHKVVRGRKGYSQVEYFYTNNNGTRNEGVDYYCSYRPVLEIEDKVSYKHLLYKDGAYGYIGKVVSKDLVPKMNSNQENGIKIESSPIWPGYEPYLAFDKENINGSNTAPKAWAAEGTAGGKGWISIEFSKSNIIKGYTLISRSPVSHINEMPKRWTFEALDENGLWVVLDARENEVFVKNIKKEYSFNNNKAFSKYRLNMVENGGPFQYSYICIGEIELLGEKENFVSLGNSLPTDEQFEQYGVKDLTEWLPFINEIQGEKKIITKASKPLQSLNVDYLPKTQFIKQNDFIKINKETLGALSINEGQTKGNIRVAAQFPDVDTFSYVFKDNTWSKIAVTDATVFSENGNTIDEMNLADWSTSPLNQQVRFIYTMKMNDIKDSVILSSIDIKLKGIVSSTPVIKKAISLIKAYTFNGYLENIERLNTINFEKLEFKSDSLINAQQNQMHNLVIDVFNSDSMESVSLTNTPEEKVPFIDSGELEEGLIKSIKIDSLENVKGIEV